MTLMTDEKLAAIIYHSLYPRSNFYKLSFGDSEKYRQLARDLKALNV